MLKGYEVDTRKKNTKFQSSIVGEQRWTISTEYRDVILGPNGLKLEEWLQNGQATIVKQGPHRIVYRVDLPEVSFYLKHNLISDLRTWFRQLIRPSKARMEYQKALEVSSRGISTIEPLGVGESNSHYSPGESFFVTKTLDQTKQLNDFLQEDLPFMDAGRRSQLRKRLAFRLGEFIARLHNNGILHDDLHCGNILIRVDENDFPHFYLIDLQAIRIKGTLGWICSKNNLIILNRWFILRTSRTDRLRFWLSYRRHREHGVWKGKVPGQSAYRAFFRDIARDLEAATNQSNRTFWKKREARWLKATRHNRVIRTPQFKGFAVSELDQGFLENLISDPDAPILCPNAKFLKNSRSAKVLTIKAKIAGKERNIIYKKIEKTNWLDPILAFFRSTAALRSWVFGHSLLERSLPTPRPLALFHRVRWGLFHESYLLMEIVRDCVGDLRAELNFLSNLEAGPKQKILRQHIRRLAILIRELHNRYLANRDLKASNILVSLKQPHSSGSFSTTEVSFPRPVQFSLIDLVGFSCRKKISFSTRVKNLARLHASFFGDQRITRTDKLRFICVYLQWGLFGREGWKDWWKKIEQATQAKIQKNLRNNRVLA